MHSQFLTFQNHGSPASVLTLESRILPPLAPGEILLEIIASPINPADLNFIEGTYGLKPTLPATPGSECFAKVLHSRSDRFFPGDPVIPIGRIGCWASHTITTAANLIHVPPTIDPLQAAMLKVNPATAWLLLHHFQQLEPGDSIALNAANSSVGQCLIQLASSLGLRTLCFLRNESLTPELTALGATHIFPDTPTGLAAATATLGNDRAKLALNAVGGESALRLMKLLAPSATHITYGAMARKPLTIPNGPLIFQDLRIRGFWLSHWLQNSTPLEIQNTYHLLAQRITDLSLKQTIDSTFPLSDFQAALTRLDSPDRHGKILFTPQS